jgi:oligopeptide/dipeptide ABC transporter ATP-binding protein
VSGPLLSVKNLSTRFFTGRGVVGAVDNVSFEVGEKEAIGIVGESGSGKSVTALSVLRLVPMPGRVVGGQVTLRNIDLLTLSEREIRDVRRNQIAMIFQDPSSFLNPIMTIGDQIGEGFENKGEASNVVAQKTIESLRLVRIPDPERIAACYPFQLSGGMQQRAVIAAAVVRRPSIIIADEPTTALDATVQFQILQLLGTLRETLNTALVLISHDLAVIASLCSRVYVMYAAQVVETGRSEQIYNAPAHPYTQGLLASIIDPLEKHDKLKAMAGSLPDMTAPPSGCRFHPRCPAAMPVCAAKEPPVFTIAPGHQAKCWLHEKSTETVA